MGYISFLPKTWTRIFLLRSTLRSALQPVCTVHQNMREVHHYKRVHHKEGRLGRSPPP